MSTHLAGTAVGVFDSREQADRAVEALQGAGFDRSQIGIGSVREKAPAEGPSGEPTWESGAGIGGMTGAALGGLAAGPAGMLTGALGGLLIGALIDLGIPEQDARWYSDEARTGRVVVTVLAGERQAEAREILRRHGGREPEPAGG